ncbi:hypothetical protein ABR737_00280 [Streptomyces sp. Edi2]|uniref:hypothetical protein n=1 Tax=Streptomyces sp. Edi2 TaxID=3162528 RepID=UPI003305E85F
MSNEMPLADEDDLPEVDEVLAAALTVQGEPGVRAVGLLEDARRNLAGGFSSGRPRLRSRACGVRRMSCCA